MARGVRKSALVKLQEELKKTQEVIEQYKAAISTQEEKALQLLEDIKKEELKELSLILDGKNMSVSELKELLASK